MKKWVGLFIFLMACSQKPGSKDFQDVTLDLGPRTKDVALDRKSVSKKSASDLFLLPSGARYCQNSSEIFEVAEELLSLADADADINKRAQWIAFSERLRSAFYSNQSNYTTFSAQTTTYLDLALGLAWDGPENLKYRFRQGLNAEKQKIADALGKLKFEMEAQHVDPPDLGLTIEQIEEFIAKIPDFLSEQGLEKSVTDKMRTELQQKYLPLIESSRAQIKTVNLNKTPTQNVTIIEQAIKNFTILPRLFMEPILDELKPAKNIARKISQANSAENIFDVLISVWKLPDPDGAVHAELKKQNEKLYSFFNSLTPEQIEWLRQYNLKVIEADDSFWSKIGYSYFVALKETWWQNLKEMIHMNVSLWPIRLAASLKFAKIELARTVGVEQARQMLLLSVNKALFKQFDAKLRSSSGAIVQAASVTILSSIDLEFSKILKNPQDFLRTEGQKQLQAQMFVANQNFVAIEDSQAILYLDENQKWKTSNRRDQVLSKLAAAAPNVGVITNGATIGSSLSLQAKRLALMDADTTVPKDKPSYWEEVFSPLNKMMAIIGFKYMESTRPRFSGLFRKIVGSGGDTEMDVFNYDRDTNIYEIPENTLIERNFKVMPAETRSLGPETKVSSIASLVRGGADMMYYFRDWATNGFDEYLGTDKAAFQGVRIFPKEAFFALSLGLDSVPLRNLTRAGLEGYGNSGKHYDGKNFDVPQDTNTMECQKFEGVMQANGKRDPVVAAALTDLGPLGQGDVVHTADMARFIIAANRFLDASEGAEESKAHPIQQKVNGFKKTRKAIKCGRQSLTSLILGLSNFLISRLQAPNFGFYHEYSIREQKMIPVGIVKSGVPGIKDDQYLEDQLYAIRALTAVYKREGLHGDAYRSLAIDAYHFLNSSLYDETLGFYRTSTTSTESKVDLRIVALTLATLGDLSDVVPPEDLDQLQFLRSEWRNKLLAFGLKTQ